MLLAIQFPSWLHPEIFPGVLPIRWYGLMYIFAFTTAYLVYRRQVKERNFPMSDEDLSGLFLWGIACLIVGARVFYALVYDVDGTFRRAPWLIFWPFRDGQFTGIQGMSFHGGVIGGILATIFYSKAKKFDYREIGDMYAASIPLGFTFGRLGNFINGELYGRITSSPIGMIFPNGGIGRWHPDFDRIVAAATEMGLTPVVESGGLIYNFPRHPSQLYQMIFEGIFLWAVIWFFRNRKPFKGFLITMYLAGYGLIRFVIEYFRQPDAAIGYRIQFVQPELPLEIAHPFLAFSTGQILSFIMIAAGLVWAFIASRMDDREPIRIYEAGAAAQAQKPVAPDAGEDRKDKNRRRKLRNRLK